MMRQGANVTAVIAIKRENGPLELKRRELRLLQRFLPVPPAKFRLM